jgi:hypothetical protein
MAVVLGALVVLCAAWYLFGRRDRRLLHVTAVLSLLLFGLGVFKIIDLYRQANDFFNRMSDLTGRVPAPFGGGGESLNFRDMFHIDPAPGLWMVAVSGLLGTVLSLFVLRQTRQQVSGASGPVTPPTGPAVPPGDLWAGDPAPQ